MKNSPYNVLIVGAGLQAFLVRNTFLQKEFLFCFWKGLMLSGEEYAPMR